MQQSKFKHLAEKIMERARERLVKTGGVPLTLFVFKADDRIKMVEFPAEVPQSVHETIKDTVRRFEGTAVVIVGEAWMTEYQAPPEEMEQVLEEITGHQPRPSTYPDRREILVVEAIHSEGSISWFVRISREGGRIVCGRPQTLEEGDTVFGGGLSDVLTR